MSEQRRIDLLFAATVRVMALGRAVRDVAPVLAMALVTVVAVHGTLGGTDAPEIVVAKVPGNRIALGPAPWIASAEPALPGGDAPATAAPAAAAPETAPVKAAPQLDREQTNIAKFIAARYRLTVDATSEFVHHAYRAARDTKLDPMLVLAVMSVESGFNPKAQSPAGAQGLMQVLTRVHADKFLPFGGIPAAFDPVANIRVGSSILKEYLQREGTVEGALKSYVGAALAEHDNGYGVKVLNARERIAAAAAGRPIPPEIVASPAPRPEPSMTPVSTIVETRTPIPPVEAPRAAPEPAKPAEPAASPEPRAAAAKTPEI